MTRICSIIAAGVLLGACSGTAEPPADLASACQVRECTCAESNPGLFDSASTTDVLWRSDGAAYCPADHELRLVPPPPPKPGGIRVN